MKQKYLFLLNILTSHEFLIQNRIELFFELVGCASVYIEFFSENLGDKLITRYNALYKGEETDNILEKIDVPCGWGVRGVSPLTWNKYRVKILRIVL